MVKVIAKVRNKYTGDEFEVIIGSTYRSFDEADEAIRRFKNTYCNTEIEIIRIDYYPA